MEGMRLNESPACTSICKQPIIEKCQRRNKNEIKGERKKEAEADAVQSCLLPSRSDDSPHKRPPPPMIAVIRSALCALDCLLGVSSGGNSWAPLPKRPLAQRTRAAIALAHLVKFNWPFALNRAACALVQGASSVFWVQYHFRLPSRWSSWPRECTHLLLLPCSIALV